MFKPVLFSLLWCSFILANAVHAAVVDVDLLGKLDNVEEHVSDDNKRYEGKYKIIQMLIKCEFDEQCELNMISELETLFNQNKNLMYKGFLTYLKWEKSDLEYNIKHCQIPEKKEVRKVYAKCYQQWVDYEINHPLQSRADIDKVENDRNLCIQENVKTLAEQGNLFAMAQLVNLNENFKNPKQMSFWSTKMDAQKGAAKYELYMKCSELP